MSLVTPRTPPLRLGELVRRTAVSARRIDYWARAGAFSSAATANGSGSRRLFDPDDVLAVRVLGELDRVLGRLPVELVVRTVAAVRAGAGRWLVITHDQAVVRDELAVGAAALVVDLDQLRARR